MNSTSSESQKMNFTYEEYRLFMANLVVKNQTTGENHPDSYVEFTRLNEARMLRLDKQNTLEAPLVKLLTATIPQTWTVLTEAWCGDAAQNLPWINLMSMLHPSISFRIILRDQNIELMDQHLTNGGRSIPKLIASDINGKILFTWGPRPKLIQNQFLKLRDSGLSREAITIELQKIYAKDKGASIQSDFIELLQTLT